MERDGVLRPWKGPDHEEFPTDDHEVIAASLVDPGRFAELFDRHSPPIHRYM
jgi:hypothetical protein